MAPSGSNPDNGSRRQLSSSPSPDSIPPRDHYRPRRNPLTPPQPSAKTHVARLAVATGLSIVLMLVLLKLAVYYLQRDWSQKQQQARSSSSKRPTATAAETNADPVGWTYELPLEATQRQMERLAADRLSPNNWLVLARGLSSKTDDELVISSLRMAMAIGDETAEIKNDFGAAYLQQKRMKSATEQFAGAEQIRPGFAPALYNLALCAVADRQPEQAIQYLGRYLAQRPQDTTALRLQTTLLSQTGRTDEALLMLEKFLKSQPADQPLFLEAAQLAARLGQTGKALRYLETSLSGNPIQSVVRTYQSSVFREIRLSGDGDRLAARMAEKARVAYAAPMPEQDIQPLRETTPEALVR